MKASDALCPRPIVAIPPEMNLESTDAGLLIHSNGGEFASKEPWGISPNTEKDGVVTGLSGKCGV